jgi:hypothetical protein
MHASFIATLDKNRFAPLSFHARDPISSCFGLSDHASRGIIQFNVGAAHSFQSLLQEFTSSFEAIHEIVSPRLGMNFSLFLQCAWKPKLIISPARTMPAENVSKLGHANKERHCSRSEKTDYKANTSDIVHRPGDRIGKCLGYQPDG